HLANSFLLQDRPGFQEQLPGLLARARSRQDRGTLCADILRAIEPFNIAGLGRPERRNWYPVDSEDLLRGAGKLEATPAEIGHLLSRTGFPASRSMLLTGLQ